MGRDPLRDLRFLTHSPPNAILPLPKRQVYLKGRRLHA
jgi:hypothetical protein